MHKTFQGVIDCTFLSIHGSVDYVIDGVSSGPELALCMDSIFGFDIDIISW